MKKGNAYLYARISENEQSNFSIQGQIKTNQDYCDRNGITILSTYTDDGRSAKNFDRPAWRKLERDLARNWRDVNYIIVMKYDRLIRNVTEGLNFLEKVEDKYNVVVVSVMEDIGIPIYSPLYFKYRTERLLDADFERRVISHRSKFGSWMGRNQGRYFGNAPYGYTNSRDEDNKPIILLNEDKASVIQGIFDDYKMNLSMKQIYQRARSRGFSRRSNSAIERVLRNCVYAGLIFVPAFEKYEAKHVKGLHDACISEQLYWETQDRLDGVHRYTVKLEEPQTPMRGVLHCGECGKLMWSGRSKGKKKYYWYYRCDCQRKNNHSAIKLHDQLKEILDGYSFSERQLTRIAKLAKEQMKLALAQSVKQLMRIDRQIRDISNKVENLEEKYISDKINEATYQKWSNKYNADLLRLQSKKGELQQDDIAMWELLEHNIKKMCNLHSVYDNSCTISEKHTFLRLFGVKWSVKNGQLEHLETPAFFERKSLKNSEMSVNKNGDNNDKIAKIPTSTRDENKLEHSRIVEFLQFLNKVG